jgi:hypothetical protein
MKKISCFLMIMSLFAGCKKNELNDIGFTDNPYDSDYSGDAVVRIDSITRVKISAIPLIYITRVHITSFIEMYSDVVLYRNDSIIETTQRTGHSNPFIETIDDVSAVSGITYIYEASLKFDSGISQPSDAVSYSRP